jgi:hypothetical protein
MHSSSSPKISAEVIKTLEHRAVALNRQPQDAKVWGVRRTEGTGTAAANVLVARNVLLRAGFDALSSFGRPNGSNVPCDDELNFVLCVERAKQKFQNGTTCLEETTKPLSAIQN